MTQQAAVDQRLVRAVVYLTAFAGAVALAAMLASAPPTLGQLAAGMVLAGATVPLMNFPYRLKPQQVIELDEIVLCAGLFLMPYGVVALAIGLGYGISAILQRWQPIKAIFNAGVKLLSGVAALSVAAALDFHAQPAAVQLGIGFLVAAIYFLSAALLVCGLSWLRSGFRLLPSVVNLVVLAAGSWFVATSAGVTVGLAAASTVSILPVAAVTVGLIILNSYRRNVHLHERRRLHQFHLAGQALAEARRREDVTQIIAPVVRELLEVDGVELRSEPPGNREQGARLPSQGVWLVVPERTLSPFNEGDEDTLAVLVNMADNSLRRIELVAELERQSLEDHLTGAGNRRRFERMLSEVVAGAGDRFTLALFDVDLFKDVNDRHGHAAGDRSLVELTAAVRAAFRSEDRLFRLGGDEFVLLLPGVSADHAAARLRDLQQRLRSLEIVHNGEPLPELAISAGVVEFPTAAANTAELLRLADQALYQAKERGRNNVVVAAASSQEPEVRAQA